MKRKETATKLSFAAICLISLFPSLAQAQHMFDEEQQFLVEENCNATRSIKKATQPTELEIGKKYTARGLNREFGASHAFINVEGKNKWVALKCGRFTDGSPVQSQNTQNQRPQATCLPFFDELDNPVTVGFGGTTDITPKPPHQNKFDLAAANICGPAGKRVSQEEFRKLFLDHPDTLDRLMKFTDNKVFADRPARQNAEQYLDDLTEAWFAITGYDHIFCGEPNPGKKGGKVGGLHFHGRYLQLQENGSLCRMNNLRQIEVVPGVIYTMGLRMKNINGRFVADARKGYGLTLNAEDLFKLITRAFAENPTSRENSTGCILDVTDDEKQFKAVFVRRKNGIRTFYPDATPNGGGRFNNPNCVAKINLQSK